MDKFNLICQQIKTNKNFCAAIHNNELLALAPQQHIAITPSAYKTPLGLLYEIKKIASEPTPHVNDSLLVLVKYNGEVSFHERAAVAENKFGQPLPWLLLRHILET